METSPPRPSPPEARTSPRRRPRAGDILFAALLLLYLAPLWGARYVPTCDGPSHLANALVVKRLLAAEGGAVGRYYALNRYPSPNLAYEWLLVAALHALPPLTAEKAVLTLVVATFALGFRHLAKAIAGGRAGPAALLFLPCALSLPFHMGFFSFVLALGLAAFALAYLWRRRGDLGPRWAVAAAAAGIIVFFAHLMGWAFFVGGLVLTAAAALGRRLKAKEYLALGIAVAAAAAPGVLYCAVMPHETAVRMSADRIVYTLVGGALRGFNGWQEAVAFAFIAVLAAAAIALAAIRIRRGLKWEAADWWLAGGAAAAAFCFVIPEWGPASGGFIICRGALLLLLCVSLWLATAAGWLRRVLWVIAPALALAYLGAVAAGYRAADRELREFNSGRCVIAAGSAFVPLIYKFPANRRGVIPYMRMAGSYYTLDRDAVDLRNYEAERPYFPVRWRGGPPPIHLARFSVGTPVPAAGDYRAVDYFICWKINPFIGEIRALVRDYDCVHATDRLLILKRKAGRLRGGEVYP